MNKNIADNSCSMETITTGSLSEYSPAIEVHLVNTSLNLSTLNKTNDQQTDSISEGDNRSNYYPGSDPATWVIDDILRDFISSYGFTQDLKNLNISNSKRPYIKCVKGVNKTFFRYFNKNCLQTTLKNGENIARSYLVYSESKGALFCYPCMLFGGVTNFATTGFSLWKKTEERITEHSNSLKHRKCMITLKNHSKRVVAVVKSLASRGLPFRGHDSKIGSPHNGNFLMALELIAEFDSFLATHLSKHGNPGKGKTSYISYQTYEQFICIMAKEVQKTIIQEIQIARYYSISVDSTPDISHTDQLSFIVRYVNEDGQPIERFLCFIEDVGHKSEQIATAVFSIFDKYDLNLKHLRGQSYDNASNMAGIYSGLQARIKKSSPHAQFVPCSAHSLNLVGKNAASCCQNAVYFFDLLQKLYVFFSSSTHRWKILNSNVKSLSETRWSARDDACKALNKNRELIINALEKIEQDVTERPATRCEAKGIIKKINTLEMSFLSLFWGDILCRFNNCSKKLQSVEINLGTVIDIYQSLITYVNDLRTDEEYIRYSNIAISISSENVMNTVNKRIKKRKTFSDENVDYDGSNNDIHFKITT
ncbi:zinc finger MYM-type protein 1-like, partial [Aphis craccivora]